MPYDEGLAQRIRELLEPRLAFTEKRMFGGIAFMVNGYMCTGISESSLMARVGAAAYPDALRQAHVRKMDFTGRPMTGYVFVDPPGIASDDDLARWLIACTSFVQTLPPKRGARR